MNTFKLYMISQICEQIVLFYYALVVYNNKNEMLSYFIVSIIVLNGMKFFYSLDGEEPINYNPIDDIKTILINKTISALTIGIAILIVIVSSNLVQWFTLVGVIIVLIVTDVNVKFYK